MLSSLSYVFVNFSLLTSPQNRCARLKQVRLSPVGWDNEAFPPECSVNCDISLN